MSTLLSPAFYSTFEDSEADMNRSLEDVPEEGPPTPSGSPSGFRPAPNSRKGPPSIRTLGSSRSSAENNSARRTASSSSSTPPATGTPTKEKALRAPGTLHKHCTLLVKSTGIWYHSDAYHAGTYRNACGHDGLVIRGAAMIRIARKMYFVSIQQLLVPRDSSAQKSIKLYFESDSEPMNGQRTGEVSFGCTYSETMQWSRPETVGETPPPSRAHTATLVDRKIVVYGGGQGSTYYDTVYVLDTVTRRWSCPNVAGQKPPPRRAHTAVLYHGKIYMFGGGNGMTALNDVWTLDVSNMGKMRWDELQTSGRKPSHRGYHTANLIGNVMIVVGGSDGKDCFNDIWCLNLDTLRWTKLVVETPHRRLSHTSTQVGSYLFIVGGHDGTRYRSDLLLFNLVSLAFEPRSTLGKAPTARGYHVTLLADSRLFLFGGFNGTTPFDEVHLLDLAAAAYLPQVTHFDIQLPE
ncbi:Galactose oxidase [Mycena sanguinolenta]|uniref:Galactose oxidase n=1 Tax=Mycena sanguinolenta TaxID=230812 RepID=A0A8H6WZ65_9AGAR|nr:Galactose oxidase [Mycena sanguinolenta]